MKEKKIILALSSHRNKINGNPTAELTLKDKIKSIQVLSIQDKI